MNTAFTYREGSINDKEQLRKLAIVSYGQFSTILTPENWAKMNDSLHDESKLVELINKSFCYICLKENEIIGMAYFVPNGNPWGPFPAEWSYIRMVGVNPDYQGQGIAKILTKMCIDKATATQEKIIALHTSEFMNAARHIYEGFGFKVIQEIEQRFGKKYWLYTLDIKS